MGSDKLTPAIGPAVLTNREPSNRAQDASTGARAGKRPTREASASWDPTRLQEKISKMRLKMEVPKLPKVKTLRNRSKASSVHTQHSVKSFSFTKPKDLFGASKQKQSFVKSKLPVASAPELPRGGGERSRNADTQGGTRSLGSKSGGAADELAAKNRTPVETARFREKSFENEAKPKAKPQKRDQKKEPTKIAKKPKVNQDRVKVNMLENKIFQKERLLKDWLQKSSVVTRLANNNYQKALNADALKYQDKVITKKDLVKAQTPSRNNKGILNNLRSKKHTTGSKGPRPRKEPAKQQMSLSLPRAANSRNPSDNKRQLSQRGPGRKNLSLQVHNLQKKDAAEFAPVLTSQRSSRSRQPNQGGNQSNRSGSLKDQRT